MAKENQAAIAQYRRNAVARRLKHFLPELRDGESSGTTTRDGVVTVVFEGPLTAVSSLGGAAKLFGNSRISIPEARELQKKKTP